MKKVVYLFPGQGSHYVGMAKNLYEQFPIARQTFEEASDILGISLSRLCFDGPLGELTKAENAHPAILTASVVAFRVYMQELSYEPHFCAGHSLGEYSALTCSGAIKFADAVRIVKYRGVLTGKIASSGIGTMSIIDGADSNTVEEVCRQISREGHQVAVSCYNSPFQIAISGHTDAVMEAEAILLDTDCQVTPLITSAPFHSPLMQPAAEMIKEKLEKMSFGYFKYPVICNVTAQPLKEPDEVINTLLAHMVKPVQWKFTMDYLKHADVTLAIEMGHKNVLANLVKANVSGIESLCYGVKEDRKTIEQIFESYPSYKKHPTIVERCLAIAVSTPNCNWDNDDYNEKVVKSYKRIEKIQTDIETNMTQPTLMQMTESLDLLKLILKIKKVDIAEQIRWFNHIIDETGMQYVLKNYELPVR